MPKMSDTMEEGVLVAWLADEGDEVASGDVIAQVETDKATMDLEVYDDGVLLKRVIQEGEAAPIGSLIAVLGKKGEDISSILAKYGSKQAAGGDGAETAEAAVEAEEAAAEKEVSEAPGGDGSSTPQPKRPAADSEKKQPEPLDSGDDGRVKASPLARRLASEHGIALSKVEGTGPEGRIVKRDIEAMVANPPAAAPETEAPQPKPQPRKEEELEEPSKPAEAPQMQPEASYETVRITQMRKAISRRLSQSKYTSPHFYLTVDVDMEGAIAFRTQLNQLAESQERPKISFNDLITKACAVALRRHPQVNASYLEKEGEIRRYRQVNVAIAVAMEEGLITPVIRNADQKGMGQIAEETRALAERARNKQLQPEEYEGSTFTTSNLGMFGIETFTAIINPPNACILAIGAIRDVPVVKDGQVVPGKRMKLTLSCDHRVVDGATGAQFLATVQQYLEEPMNLLL